MIKRGIAIPMLILISISLSAGQEGDIFDLVQAGSLERVEERLQTDPLQVNATDRAGRTPLYAAIWAGNLEMARLLIERGALVRVGDFNLRAPIHFANWRGDKSMIDLLVEKGAVVDTRAIGAATPLIHASLNDNFEMARHLIERGADIDVQCNSLTTPLYFAVLNNDEKYFDYLVRAGAGVDDPDFLGRTPLAVAVRDGNARMAAALVENGADPFRKDGRLGRSLLHLAAAEGHADVIDVLLRAGLEVSGKDQSGSTPLDCARRYGHVSAAGLLEARGGKEGDCPDRWNARRPPSPELKTGEAEIVKLQNGSWAVNTRSAFLVFGYSEIGAPPPERSLAGGYLTADVLDEILARGRAVIYLDREFHPAGRAFSLEGFNPFYEIQKEREDISFILNPAYDRLYARVGLKKAVFPRQNEMFETGGLKGAVYPSYGSHSCLTLEVDGLTIVWLTGISDAYQSQKRDASVIDRLARDGIRPDILFLGSPSGIGPEIGNGIREAFLEARRLKPRSVFAFGHEPLERRIKDQVRRRIGEAKELRSAGHPGDFFSVNIRRKP